MILLWEFPPSSYILYKSWGRKLVRHHIQRRCWGESALLKQLAKETVGDGLTIHVKICGLYEFFGRSSFVLLYIARQGWKKAAWTCMAHQCNTLPRTIWISLRADSGLVQMLIVDPQYWFDICSSAYELPPSLRCVRTLCNFSFFQSIGSRVLWESQWVREAKWTG